MKKQIILLILLSLISYSSFAIGFKSHTRDYQQIRESLESEISIGKEELFIEREFNPFLNEKWIGNAVSYGCYREGQAPGVKGPSKEEILEDLEIISKHWNLIRVYNADDDTERILQVIREHKLPIKVMLGVWLENEDKDQNKKTMNIDNVMRCLELTEEYSEIITAVNVGNETQVFWSWHKMAEDDLIRYIRTVRKHTEIPVTTADDYNFWNKPDSKNVAGEVDFIVTHIYPLWNGKKLIESIEWLSKNYAEISEYHQGKMVVLGEIGWATDYNSERKGPGEQGTLVKGEVSVRAQEEFLMQLEKWSNDNKITTFWFEVFDEPWKGGGINTPANEIEKNWGLFYENREPKQSFRNYIKDKFRAY